MLRCRALYNKRFWNLSHSTLLVERAQVYLAECIQSVIHSQFWIEYPVQKALTFKLLLLSKIGLMLKTT